MPCFNSRSRVGSDGGGRQECLGGLCFNSRSRVGSDEIPGHVHAGEAVSIRAPAWGATKSNISRRAKAEGVSIRAPAWGATLGDCS